MVHVSFAQLCAPDGQTVGHCRSIKGHTVSARFKGVFVQFLRRLTGDITVRCHRHRSYKRKECDFAAVLQAAICSNQTTGTLRSGHDSDDFASAAVHHRANGKGKLLQRFAPCSGRDVTLYPFFAQNAVQCVRIAA